MTEPTSLAQQRWPAVFAHQFLPRVIFGDTTAKVLEMFGNPELAPLFVRFLVDNVAKYCGFPEGAWKSACRGYSSAPTPVRNTRGNRPRNAAAANSSRLLLHRYRSLGGRSGSLLHPRTLFSSRADHALRVDRRPITCKLWDRA